MEKDLNISTLKSAAEALRKSIDVFNQNISNENIDLKDTLRSGIIQNFEVAYELSWKFMKKWMEINIHPDIVAGVTRKEFYRIAGENLLISDMEQWWEFHKSRNKTSHLYSGTTAEEVFETALEFLPIVQEFVERYERKLC